MKTYKGLITKLPENGIFVFGSNTEGRHGKGAALIAYGLYGALYGIARGPQGRSYAICTKDLNVKSHPSISKREIMNQITLLYGYAFGSYKNKHRMIEDFYIAYSSHGTNLNGYTAEEMAEMFAEAINITDYQIPPNIVFEEGFSLLVKKYLKPDKIMKEDK